MRSRVIRNGILSTSTLAAAVCTGPEPARAQCAPTTQGYVTPVTTAPDDHLGSSCAISGDLAVVGAPLDDSFGQDAGSVYILEQFNGFWYLTSHLGMPSGSDAGDQFGLSVALSGETLVVGAPYDDSNGIDAGSIWIFERIGGVWTWTDTLVGSDTGADDLYGRSVDVHNGVIVVGAPQEGTVAAGTGAAYVVERQAIGWGETAKLAKPSASGDNWLGASVAVFGGRVVVGAPGKDNGLDTDAGAAYGYTRLGGGWSYPAELVDPSPSVYEYFGQSVDVGPETYVVGAPGLALPWGTIVRSGAAYVFTAGPTQELKPLPDSYYTDVARAVALDGDTIVLGSSGLFYPGIWLYERANSVWTSAGHFSPTYGAYSFGASCDVSNGVAIVGAPVGVSPNPLGGSATVLDLDGLTNLDPCLETEVVALAGSSELKVSFSGPQPQSFSWRRNGVPLVEGGHVSGAGTSTLTVAPCGLDDEGEYDVVVSNTCGSVVSGLAPLKVVCGQVEPVTELSAANLGPGDIFGTSVDLDGPYVVATAQLDDNVNGVDAGSVKVFEETASGWVEKAPLLHPAGADYDRFGYDAAISDDRILVGAGADDVNGAVNAGSAIVFLKSGNGWVIEEPLAASDYAANHYFGRQVDLDGDVAVIAAHAWSSAQIGINAGAVYVFRRGGATSYPWTEEARLHARDAAADDSLGTSVSNDCDRIVAGAEGRDDLGTDSGAAYVFRHVGGGSWIQEAKLVASDGAANDKFGHTVAIAGDTLVVGAPRHNGGRGAAYVFRRSGSDWTQEKKLTAFDAAAEDRFGERVAIDGDVIVVGSWWDDDAGSDSGSAYAFTRQGGAWPLIEKVLASDGAAGDGFGVGVAVRGGRAVVGAYRHDGHAGPVDAGSAYVYDLGGERPSTYCTAKVNSLGCLPAIGSSGTPSASNFEPFLVTATNVLGQKAGLMFYGSNGAAAIPFQGGTKCVAAPTWRTPIQMSGGNPAGDDCSGSYAFDFNDHAASGVDPALVAGVDVHAQYWTRDPQSPSTTGLTDGLHFLLFP